MTKRVLMQSGQAAALQVSLPGYDVTTATLDQMAFDARMGNLRKIIEGGVGIAFPGSASISYPTSYATIPRVVAIFVPSQTIFSPSGPVISCTAAGALNARYGIVGSNLGATFFNDGNQNGDPAEIPNSYFNVTCYFAAFI